MKVLGIERVDYTNKAGKHIEGYKLHLGYEKDNTLGTCVMSEYVKEIPDVEIGHEVELYYNKFGKVNHVNIISF